MTNEIIESIENKMKWFIALMNASGCTDADYDTYDDELNFLRPIRDALSNVVPAEVDTCKYCDEYGTKTGPQFYIEFTRLITPKTFDDYMIDADFCPKCGRKLKV